MMRKITAVIIFTFFTCRLFAQMPEVESKKDVVTATNNILKVKRVLELPHDTICTASIGSIAEMDGVAYIKDIMYWKAIGANVLTEDISFKWAVNDSLNTPDPNAIVGDKFLVGNAPTGAFVGNANSVAVLSSTGYVFQTPVGGDLLNNANSGWVSKWTGTAWVRQGRAVIHQNGDAFKGIMYIGTNDAYAFRIKTNKVDRFIISAAGDITLNKLKGTDTGFVLLEPSGKIVRRELLVSNDTSTYKPVAINSTGHPVRMNAWPGGGTANGVGYGLLIDSSKYKADTTKLQTKLGWFDVVSYGADTTGAKDATAAIQAAINAAFAHGGGVVYFRNGTYKIAGPLLTSDGTNNIDTAQLYIPFASWSSGLKVHITLLGEAPPNEFTSRAQTVQVTKGVVLRSTNPSTTGGRVIGNAWKYSDATTINYNEVTIENINIKVRSLTESGVEVAPTMTGLGFRKSAMMNVRNCVVNTESAMSNSLQAAPTAIGIECPGNGNWARVRIENTTVYNFYTGIQVSEHANGDNVYVATCTNGIEIIEGGHGVYFDRVLSQWNVNSIKVSGTSYFTISQLDIEDYSTISGNPSKWYLPNLDIYEPITTGSLGVINYQHSTSNLGVSNAVFAVSGTLSPGIKYRTVNDFYSTFGINTNSPKARLHVVSTAVPSFPVIQTSDREIGENNGDYYRSFVLGTSGSGGFRWYKSGGTTFQGALRYDVNTNQMEFYTNSNTTSQMNITSAGNLSVAAGKFFVDATNGRVAINTVTPQKLFHISAATTTLPTQLGVSDFMLLESTGNFNTSIVTGATSSGYLKWFKNGSTRLADGAFGYDQSVQQFKWATDARDISTIPNMVLDVNGNLGINTNSGAEPNSKFQVVGSIAPGAWRSIASSRTLDATDATIEYTGTGGQTITLPTAVGITNRWYTIINAGTGSVSIATTSGQTIGNTTSDPNTINLTPGQYVIVSSSNTNWRIITIDKLQQSRVSTQFNTTTNALANVTSLVAYVAAGKTYRFEAKLYTTSNVNGGVKAAIGGTATATNIIYEGLATDSGITTQGRGTSLGTQVATVTAVSGAYIAVSGTITVSTSGTITVQFAQNVSNASVSSVLAGSTFVVSEML